MYTDDIRSLEQDKRTILVIGCNLNARSDIRLPLANKTR